MPLRTDSDEFEEVFDREHLTAEFLRILGEYLENNKNTPEMKEMGRWLQEGKKLSGFTCRADVLPTLMDKLNERQIPFILIQNVKGEYGVLIRITDTNNAQQTIEETLKVKARFIKMLSGKQFREALIKENTLDKNILYINGLSEEELLTFVDSMKESYGGLSVGVEKRQDGSFSLLLHAKSVMKKQDGIKPVTYIAVQNAIFLNGKDSLLNQKKAIGKLKVEEMLFSNFENGLNETENAGYIYGSPNQYIKIGRGLDERLKFESGFIMIENGTLDFNATENGDVLNDKEMLMSKTAAFESVFYSTSIEEVTDYFTKLPQENYKTKVGERKLTDQLDKLVNNRLQSSMITKEEKRWSGKFQAYTKETADLLDGFSKGMIPTGYTQGQIDSLQKICTEYGLEPADYRTAAAAIKNIETREEPAKIEIREFERPQKQHETDTRDFRPIIRDIDRDWGDGR